jgi:branched-chain amino acid transport system permease protein
MERFLGDVIPGIPYGCVYALVAVALVLTYQATGVFNFAFGAQAFMSAFVFAILTQNDGLPVWAAFLVSVVVLAPVVGLVADRMLFRRIPNTNTTAKMVTSLTLLVAIPALLPVIFGNQNIYGVSPILFNPDTVYTRLAGYPVNGDDLSAVVVAVAVLAAMVGLMRFTSLGLQMRGAVESRRLVELDGVNADRVVAAAWMISSFLAGLAGVLLAPVYGQLQSQDYLGLMVAAIAAAAWGALRSMPIAALAAVVLGVTELVAQGYLPTSSVLYTGVLPSLPFIALVLALLFLPGMRNLGRSRDPLATVDPPPARPVGVDRAPRVDRIVRVLWFGVLIAFVVSMLTWMPPSWEGVFNSGLAFSVIFLSITLITGMAGQLSLAQGTLAGVGAFSAAQLANHLGLNMLLGLVVGALLAAAVALVLAVLSLRLVGLGLTLMTLAAAIFFDNTVFAQSSFTNGTSGLDLQQSWVKPFNLFSTSGHSYFIVALTVLVVVVVGVVQIRRGSEGLFLRAMRGSEVGAAGTGINLTWLRLVVFAISGAIAGVGGTLLVLQQQVANPGQFNYQISIAFVVIVITLGVGTVEGAIQAGIGFAVVQQLFTYAPPRFEGLTFALFAVGAATYAAHPEGIIEYQKRRAIQRIQRPFDKTARASLAMSATEARGVGR